MMKHKLLSLFVALVATTALWASNTITYTASSQLSGYNGSLSVGATTFGPAITSHTFSNGTGTITCSGEITTIGERAFQGCSGLTSVTIPNSVTTIGYDAFGGCYGLTSVTIPNSVTTIGYGAFGGCYGLTKTNYTGTIADWCKIKFYSDSTSNPICRSHNFFINDVEVKDLVIDNVDMIGNYTFYGCDGLTSVTIGNSVTTIGDEAFFYCRGLTSVTIGNSVTTIGNYAFYYCRGLTGALIIPNSVTTIGYDAFFDCRGLTSVTIGNSVATIGKNAFAYCSGLTSVTIPNSVTTIGNYAFYYCSGLTGALIIPNSVTTIGYDAFYGCDGLTSVTIGNSVTTIGNGAFDECSGLTSIDVAAANTHYASIDGVLFNYAKDTLIQCPAGNARKEYTIPNSVTTIGEDAFRGCYGLTSVTIPNSVTEIGYSAFYNCSSLISITIPNSVTTIGSNAFYGCKGLTSVTIPNSVTTIGRYAFAYCSGLTSVTIPNSVTEIGYSAFYNCSSLTSITIPNSVTTIGDYAFFDCRGLTSITIPNSVTTIGNYAFCHCSGLTSLTCEATTPPTCGYNYYSCFYSVDKSIPLYVPAGSIDAYKAANQWKDFTNIQAIVDWDDNHPDNPGFYEIAVSASPQEGGIVSGGGLYADGDTVTISAIANDGYEFVDWSNGCLTNSQDIVLHSRDTALIANFKRTVLDTVIISDEQSISTLPVGAITHVIVRETGKLNLDQATEIRSLTLHQCGNQAAQVTHIERLNDCMVDMVIHLEPAAANAIPNKWYAFAVPFDVDTNSGIRRDGATQVAVPGVDFQIDEYDGALRASTQQGWKRNTDTLKPGKFFMFATNSTANDWRFTKTPDSTLMEQSLITVAEYPAAKKHHAGWNGLSNTLFENANAVCENLTYATIYNNPTNTYQTVLFDSYTFCPTQPFLVQVETQSVVELQPLDILQAPAREVETSITTLSLCQVMENKVPSVDYAYFTITDEETTEYVIGKDLLKMKTANSVVPQIWINAYNLQLAAHEVQMENNMLALALGLYAPNNGEYILRSDNMAISVLCNGVALPAYSDAQGLFWKLNMIQGTNENYSVSIKNLPTAIDQTDNTSINSHKFIKNNHLYILRDGNLYTATGARVK